MYYALLCISIQLDVIHFVEHSHSQLERDSEEKGCMMEKERGILEYESWIKGLLSKVRRKRRKEFSESAQALVHILLIIKSLSSCLSST